MSTYIFSKWKNSPEGCPDEFYSELNSTRREIRKVEVFKGGELGFASKSGASSNTRLGTEPVPSVAAIQRQAEFDIEEISKEDFEVMWKTATEA